ncbi:hypothetical protein BJX76DRAFT_325751 [Aspergillus varians]
MLSCRVLGSFLKNSTASRFARVAPSFAQARRETSSYLLKAVETDENERLDIQHRMNIHMMHQSLLHPSIPKNIGHVADIATGNGTWLRDLKKARNEAPTSTTTSTKYHGFDISPALFPMQDSPQSVADIDFSVHDFYSPFPDEHIGKYDLVHARHLVLAVQGDRALTTAVKNITSLLKPGGHIQWEEYDFQYQLEKCTSGTMGSTWHIILNWVAERGYSLTFADSVQDELAATGLEVVEKKRFGTEGLPLSEDHRLTLIHSFWTGVPKHCLKVNGKSEEEAEAIVASCLEELERGVLLDYYMSRVVARRPVG